MFDRIGVTELLIVALLLLVFFGGKKLPEFIKGLGEGVKEFKKGIKDESK